MGFTDEGRKKILYGPIVQLSKEMSQVEDEQL